MTWRGPLTGGLLGLVVLAACSSAEQLPPPSPVPTTVAPAPSSTSPGPMAEGSLFRDQDGTLAPPTGPMRRSRLVTLDTSLLLDAGGDPRRGPLDLTLNLFPDVSYRTRVTLTSQDSETDVWEGPITGLRTSSVMILRVNDVFIVKAASPAGVFEVSSVAGGYQIIELNQTAMPGEG